MQIDIILVERLPWDLGFFENIMDVATDTFVDNLREYLIFFLSCEDHDIHTTHEAILRLSYEHNAWCYAQVQEMKEYFDD